MNWAACCLWFSSTSEVIPARILGVFFNSSFEKIHLSNAAITEDHATTDVMPEFISQNYCSVGDIGSYWWKTISRRLTIGGE